MTSASEIMERRNVRRNLNLAVFISIVVHALLIGAFYYNSQSSSHAKQEVVTSLHAQKVAEKP